MLNKTSSLDLLKTFNTKNPNYNSISGISINTNTRLTNPTQSTKHDMIQNNLEDCSVPSTEIRKSFVTSELNLDFNRYLTYCDVTYLDTINVLKMYTEKKNIKFIIPIDNNNIN